MEVSVGEGWCGRRVMASRGEGCGDGKGAW